MGISIGFHLQAPSLQSQVSEIWFAATGKLDTKEKLFIKEPSHPICNLGGQVRDRARPPWRTSASYSTALHKTPRMLSNMEMGF